MAKFPLSKSKTGVFLFVYTLISLMGFTTAAEDVRPTFGSSKPEFCSMKKDGDTTPLERYAELMCKDKRDKNTGSITNDYEKCKQKVITSACSDGDKDARRCEDATKGWETAKKEFIKACGEAKIQTGGKKGDVACAPSMRKCNYCGDASDSEDDMPGMSCEVADADDSSSSTDKTKSLDISEIISRNMTAGTAGGAVELTPDINESRTQYTNCPALAGADLKQWQDEYKDSKKSVEDLQTKITKLEGEIADMQSDAEKNINKLQDQADQIQSDAKDAAQKATKDLEGAQKQMADDITKLNDEITKENAGLRQLDIGRVQAQTALADTVSRLDLQCHASALQRVEAERQEKLRQIQNSTYSAGDMNSLFSGTGLSSRQKNQQLTDQYFEFCKKDRAYTMALASANKAFNLAMQQADEGRRNIQDRIVALNKKIDTIKTSDAARAMQNTLDQITKIQENMNKQLDKLKREQMQIQQAFTRSMQNKQKDLQQQQARLAEEETYLKRKKEFLALKTRMSKGMATTEDKVWDASGKYLDLGFQAKRVFSECNCAESETAGPCSAIEAFMLQDGLRGYIDKARKSALNIQTAPDKPVGRVPAGSNPSAAPGNRNGNGDPTAQ